MVDLYYIWNSQKFNLDPINHSLSPGQRTVNAAKHLHFSELSTTINCSINIPLNISCNGDSWSVNVDAEGYSATVDEIDGAYLFITLTDTDSSDNSQDCTENVSATVTCNDPDSWPFDETALVVVNMPDGVPIESFVEGLLN